MNKTAIKNADPAWWNQEYDSAWERTKAALQRDWEQTKHDFGGDEPDTDQDVDDTIAQAAGRQAIPPSGEPTYEDQRFGYGARRKYGKQYKDWNDEVEAQLKDDWNRMHPEERDNWGSHRPAIRYGWDYQDE